MTEAGQIFALLRSSSAAELAKRFASLGEGTPPPVAPTAPRAGGEVAPGGQSGSGPTLPNASPTPAGGPGAPQPSTAPHSLGGTVPVGQAGAVDGHSPTAPNSAPDAAPLLADQRPVALRAALSLANLAPPKADLVRLLAAATGSLPASGALAGDAAAPGAGGPASSSSGGPLAAGSAPGMVEALRAAAVASGMSVDSETLTQLMPGQLSGRGAAAANGGPGIASAPLANASGGAAPVLDAADPSRPAGFMTGSTASGQASAAAAAVPPTSSIATVEAVRAAETAALVAAAAGAPAAATMGEAPGLSPRMATVAQTAFAEAVFALIDAASAGRSGSAASGVIFNAAMIPGWPFPTAFAKDGPDAINPKALLHRLATAVEGMSPQEAAEYLAQIGGAHVLLRNLRRILRELDGIEKDDVKGLLFAFLETLGAIATGLQTAFKLLAESAALQAAVAHGEVPPDDGRPGRRRIRL